MKKHWSGDEIKSLEQSSEFPSLDTIFAFTDEKKCVLVEGDCEYCLLDIGRQETETGLCVDFILTNSHRNLSYIENDLSVSHLLIH